MEWIKVTDRLPDKSFRILARGKDYDVITKKYSCCYNFDKCECTKYRIELCEYDIDYDAWVYDCCKSSITDITHWAEIPEPPKD